ncbi:helix-turn-helix domain-containing protein [Cohnella sp. GCM10020058]|uniref:helix-turn-helix domain-containing protein n=1 Tax=Cohnella sp. GCM10020058 TaxID=3317330 RepID=UPI0036267D5C
MSEIKFKERLALLRKKRNLTQADLAKRLDLSQSTLAMWENGRRSPDMATVTKIAAFFNVSLNYLLGFTEDPISDGLVTTEDPSLDEDYHKIERFARLGSKLDRKRAIAILDAAFDHAFSREDDDDDDDI